MITTANPMAKNYSCKHVITEGNQNFLNNKQKSKDLRNTSAMLKDK